MPLSNEVLDSITVAIVVVDDHLGVEFMNNAAEDFCGGSIAHFRGRPLSALFVGKALAKDILQECFDTYETYSLREIDLHLGTNKQRATANVAVTPIVGRRLLLEIDPLDRMRFITKDDQMRQTQLANRQLVRGMAHEIKNPLGSIRGAAQLLRKQLSSTDQIDYTDLIIEEVDRLRSLVDRMLSPNHTPCFDGVNIHEVIQKVVRVIESNSGTIRRLDRDFDPSIPPVLGDFDQLTQALLNLLQNSVEATQAKSTAHITIRTGIEHQFTIGAKRHAMVARIQVEDNGTGIPPAIQDQIFFPLVTGKSDGTGLGLAITSTIIGMHDGLVVCESEPEQTKFVVYLPLALRRAKDEVKSE